MSGFDQDYFDRVTEAVQEAETKTAAEVVVAVHPQTGSSRHVDSRFGPVAALTGLVFIVFNPWTVHPPALLPLEMAALFGIGTLGCSVCPPLRRLLTSGKRRGRQTEATAQALFCEEGVANTRARTGVLIYLSLLERELAVMADVGIVDGCEPEAWSRTVFELRKIGPADDSAAALIEGVRRLGDVLGEYLPAGEDNPDEIPNRPRTKR